MMDESLFERLRQFLATLPTGPVPPERQPELVQLLADCWDLFDGSDQEAMESYKLERMEAPYWNPPILTFTIERHGATVMGSTRAELQDWVIDLERKVADCQVIGHRQVSRRQAAVDVKPIADELVGLIISGSRDERLQWSTGGSIQVLSSRIFPWLSAPKQTVEGRRSRLCNAIEECLAPHGWHRLGSWWERKE